VPEVQVTGGTGLAAFQAALEGHVLAVARITGHYQR
jgi:hypothetical protein